MNINDTCCGFTVLKLYDLPTLMATGIWLRHTSGMEVFHIMSDDEENLFGFTFPTAPTDSTGVAHILEHSVLCGSKNFPLKDPFLQLSNQSIKTFLNAMTFPDKTVYPASSLVEADYFNVMAVYGDAVFFPRLERWIFEQEAHRFEYNEDGQLTIQGVVYNEMKGSYSSFENIAADWTVRSILPGTPYEYDSGGDPECICDLTYEQFCNFHATHYAPSQCKLFLYGNIPTEKQLAFIEERFLKPYDFTAQQKIQPAVDGINLSVIPFDAPRRLEVSAPCSESAEKTENTDACKKTTGENGSTVLLNWLFADSTDPLATMESSFIAEILLGHDGSPLSHALIDSHIGEDISPNTGLETELRQMIFSVGLRGMDKSRADELETLILSTLQNLCKNGINQDDIDAAFMSLDFANREIRRSSSPFSLTLMRRSLKGWIHGKSPRTTLLYDDSLACIKNRLQTETNYIENLIQRLFLQNNHRTTLIVVPDPQYDMRLQQKLQDRLTSFESQLTEDKKTELKAAQAELNRLQQTNDPKELTALIPHLKPSDLSIKIENIETKITMMRNVYLFSHTQGTNGIGYIEVGLPIDVLSSEDLPYLPFFTSVLTSMGFTHAHKYLNWKEAASLIAKTTGGFGANIFTGSAVHMQVYSAETPYVARSWLFMRAKMLEEKIPLSLSVLFDCLRTADFTDIKRLADLALEFRNDFDSSVIPAGNQYASSRASCSFSRHKALDELWNGISQLYTAHHIAEMDMKELSQKLTGIHQKLLSNGAVVNTTGTKSVLHAFRKQLPEYLTTLVPLAEPKNISDADIIALTHIPHKKNTVPTLPLEVFTTPMQVGFAALAFRSSLFGTPQATHEMVFAHWLTNTFLWERIRTIGGAYGAFSYPDPLEGVFTLTSYRDPNPESSLETFKTSIADAAKQFLDSATLERTITGTYSKEVQPRSPASKGFTGFVRTLYGITDEIRQKKLYDIIHTTAEDIQAVAVRFTEELSRSRQVLIQSKPIKNTHHFILPI